MSTAFATLCADEIDAQVEALLDVLGMADHTSLRQLKVPDGRGVISLLHVVDARLVQSVHRRLRGYADSRYEQLGTRVNDDRDQLVHFPFCVVVAADR